MPILERVEINNFRCFRKLGPVLLGQATYLVGANNSGKTAFLSALQCFFDGTAYSSDYLNRTEFSSRQPGYNRSDITVTFDLRETTGRVRRKRLQDAYGNSLTVRKSFTFREASKTVVVEYRIGETIFSSFDDLPEDTQLLLSRFAVSYIHPQEGNDLLLRAQAKFKERLFSNWGRHPSVGEKLRVLQAQWDDLRHTANTYLSAALSANLRAIWPESHTTVDLPERVQDVVAISDITFRSSPSLPEITLTSQGTGAQATILYQTHYILDSDRSLHRGMYFPIWLLEEPEAFLHADIAAKLGRLLSSDDWLQSIQMIISTHSPIILAASRQNSHRARWVLFEGHAMREQHRVADVTEGTVNRAASLMGDANFDAYFAASLAGPIIAIEDVRQATQRSFVAAGIPVTLALHGTSDVKKHIMAFSTLPGLLRKHAYFVVDSDKGAREFSEYCRHEALEEEDAGWRRYAVADGVSIVLLPEGSRSEDLFAEFDDVLDECAHILYEGNLALRKRIPTRFSRTASDLRRSGPPESWDQVRLWIRNTQDVKDHFWSRVDADGLHFSEARVAPLKRVLGLAET